MRIDISNRIGTTSNFGGFRGLLDKFSGAAAGYSLRKLSKSATNAVRVRRSSDNTEQDIGFVGTELDTTTLLDFVNARDVAPADYGAGAAAAYSLRYVSDSYTGDVVRVRRDSDNAEADFNPTEITDGTLLAWVGNTASDNGHVTTWYDQSGNSNDATQGTAASQPKIVDAGVLVEENGKPAVDFDGNAGLRISDFDYGLTNKLTLFANLKYNSIATGVFISHFDYGVPSRSWNLRTSSLNYYISEIVQTDSPITTQSIQRGTLTPSQQNLLSGIYDLTQSGGDKFLLYQNSTLLSLGASSGSVTSFNDSSADIVIGAQLASSNLVNNLTGKIQEIIIYPSDQSSNRGNIEANVNDYYSIYTSTNDGFVTTWYDQSGNGNDATQATAASQPQIVSSGSVILENGKPAVSFDGLDDYLLNGITANYTTYSEIVVAKSTGNSTFSTLIAHNSGATAQQGYLGTRNNGADWGTFDSVQRIFGSVSGNLDLISRYKNVSNSISNYVNRILGDVYTSTQNTTPALIGVITQPIFLGQYQGYVSEIVIYPSDQSGNRTAIEGNINGHYNIYP